MLAPSARLTHTNEMTRQPPKKHRKRPAPATSGNAKLVGYVVLLAGVLAVLGVGVLAYQKFSDPAAGTAPGQQDLAFAAGQDQKQIPPAVKGLNGSWLARLPTGNAVIQIGDGAYQIVMDMSGSGYMRRYSRGTVRQDGDFIILEPRSEYGAPDGTAEGHNYFVMTMRAFPVKTSVKGDIMIWEPGPKILVGPSKKPSDHPLFADAGQPIIRWDRVE